MSSSASAALAGGFRGTTGAPSILEAGWLLALGDRDRSGGNSLQKMFIVCKKSRKVPK